jgi:hypothetical protein
MLFEFSIRPTVLALLLSVALCGIAGCDGTTDADDKDPDDTGSDDSVNASSSIIVGDWDIVTGENSADLIENYDFTVLDIYLSDDSIVVSSDTDTLAVETLTSEQSSSDEETTLATVTLEDTTVITISTDTYGINIESTAPEATLIEYALQGGFTQTVTIYSDNDFKLSLNGITINSADGPAINIQSKQRAFIELPENTVSYLYGSQDDWSDRYLDSEETEEMDLKATFFSEGPLIFDGAGSLNITAYQKHAVTSDDHVRLVQGSISLTANEKDGIRANDAFIMDGGNLTINADEGKGIKVKGKEDDTAPIGFIAINDGALEIESYDKAITAAWESDEDGDTTTLNDDPDPRVTINGGTLTITTNGEPYDDGDDSLSPEGIEAKSVLTINEGELAIESTDDALNAGTGIVINGGEIYAVSSENDAVDSNGILTIAGGLLVAIGADGVEGGLDNDDNTFSITGGTFVGIGGRNSTPTSSATTQNTISMSDVSSGLLAFTDSDGNIAFAYDMPDDFDSVLLGGPDFKTDTGYTVNHGGTIGSYSYKFNGLYITPYSLTGGATGRSFTIRSTVTSL